MNSALKGYPRQTKSKLQGKLELSALSEQEKLYQEVGVEGGALAENHCEMRN